MGIAVSTPLKAGPVATLGKEEMAVTRQSKTLDKKRQDMTRQIHQTTQDIKAIRVKVRVRVMWILKIQLGLGLGLGLG